LRKVLYDYVPREYLERPKQGFGVPTRNWLRRDMRVLIDRYIEPGLIAAQASFDTECVRTCWHVSGQAIA